jgi:hypothetical protein
VVRLVADKSQEFPVTALYALRDLVFITYLSVCASAGVTVPAAAQANRIGVNKIIRFDIPTQPLAQALDAYARTTGMAALVDRELIGALHSTNVKGLLPPDQALRILLAGTNLTARYANGSSFTLEPASQSAIAKTDANIRTSDPGGIRQTYFADLQDALSEALCHRPETSPGRYRLGLQLWIAANGTVLALHLLDSTGDVQRDAAITDMLGSSKVAPPPAGLPQPVTVVLRTRSPEQIPDCREQHPG